MNTTMLGCCLLLGALLLLLSGDGNTVAAWNQHVFNRYSRNLLRRGSGGNGVGVPNGGDNINAAGLSNANSGYDELKAVFGLNNGGQLNGQQTPQLQAIVQPQPEPEIYGIVEPLIEDMPCADRACVVNDDCCPTGVCVNAYGGSKCVYGFVHTRELCQHNGDCEPDSVCLKDANGIWLCQRKLAMRQMYELKQFGDECISSADCNLAKGMCCQLQRSHHRMLPKKLCAYFRDPFVCIDITPNDDEEIREGRLLNFYNRRQRM